MKYRIVETEGGTYRIQKSLFGLIWFFVKEKRYKRNAFDFFVEYASWVIDYKTEKEAKESLEKIKNEIVYKGYHILYGITECGQHAYFIPTKKNRKIFALYDAFQRTMDDVKYWLDIREKNKEFEKKKYKVKRILA